MIPTRFCHTALLLCALLLFYKLAVITTPPTPTRTPPQPVRTQTSSPNFSISEKFPTNCPSLFQPIPQFNPDNDPIKLHIAHARAHLTFFEGCLPLLTGLSQVFQYAGIRVMETPQVQQLANKMLRRVTAPNSGHHVLNIRPLGPLFVMLLENSAFRAKMAKGQILVSKIQGTTTFDPKPAVWKLLHDWFTKKGCTDKMTTVFPTTLHIRKEECDSVMHQVRQWFGDKNPWITKSPTVHMGEGLKIFPTINAWYLSGNEQEQSLCEEYDDHLLQVYHKPFLWHGKKFGLRFQLLILSTMPWIAYYRTPMLLKSLSHYDHHNFSDPGMHYTNQHAQEKSSNYSKSDVQATLVELSEYVASLGLMTKDDFTEYSLNSIARIAQIWLQASIPAMHPGRGTWQDLGLDLILTDHLEYLLLDVNNQFSLSWNHSHFDLERVESAYQYTEHQYEFMRTGSLSCDLAFQQSSRPFPIARRRPPTTSRNFFIQPAEDDKPILSSGWCPKIMKYIREYPDEMLQRLNSEGDVRKSWMLFDERWGVDYIDPWGVPQCPRTSCDCGYPKIKRDQCHTLPSPGVCQSTLPHHALDKVLLKQL